MTLSDPLWRPSHERVRGSQMCDFMQGAAQRHGFAPEWSGLHAWSVRHRDVFWGDFLAFAGIEPSTPHRSVISGDGMLDTRWFEGMRINYARHLLRFDDDQPAILFESEIDQTASLNHRELRDAVARCAAGLRRDGVKSGDRVGGFMPNIPEAIIAMLAATSLGAIWSSCSPDFGAGGVLDRFGQIEPTVLFTADGYTYGGRRFDSLPRVREILDHLPSVQRVVVVPFVEDNSELAPLQNAVIWHEYLGVSGGGPQLAFEEVPFDHPLFIMYSSGTTGVPKCIVHGHGGTLLQHMKELMLHCDLRSGRRAFYYTTCGWMMWNWLVSTLGTGAAVVLYEGSPAHPDLHHLWEMAARTEVNLFGTSPKFISACQKSHMQPGREHDLSALRCVCSTGAPLSVEQFEWVYANVKADLQLSSISGGTDIISCFMLGNPILPVYAGEIQCCGLGMDVQAWDTKGRSLVGKKGELVCKSPFPSQPVSFWKDPDNAKYRAAYFEHYPGVWRHGDFVEITPHGGVIVYGRSDATLNPGGVRIGTAEIYRVVEAMPEVVDSIAVGRRSDDDVEIVLFVVLGPGTVLDADLKKRLRTRIAEECTKRHVPKHIRQVTSVPYTISGKKVELAVTQLLHGEAVLNKDALANPESLEQYKHVF